MLPSHRLDLQTSENGITRAGPGRFARGSTCRRGAEDSTWLYKEGAEEKGVA
jgi:hypothetical protein